MVKKMYECRIAERLAQLRALKGVTQGEVAESLSVSNKTVSKWESGVSAPELGMLVELARYYGVTTDDLLGVAKERSSGTEELCLQLSKLERGAAVLKAFETVRSFVPAIYDKFKSSEDTPSDRAEAIPRDSARFYRNELSANELFELAASSENANVAVMLLGNRANFAWLRDKEKQGRLCELFRMLSEEDMLSVLYFLHSTACAECFTPEYIARGTGIEEARARELLDRLCSIDVCSCFEAQLVEGETRIYKCFGDGIILSMLTLAFEKMCGRRVYDYCYNAGLKLIGEGEA